MKVPFILQLTTAGLLFFASTLVLPATAHAFYQQEQAEKEERRTRGAEKRENQESRRASQGSNDRDQRNRRRTDSLNTEEGRRDSSNADRRNRGEKSQVDEEEREERRATRESVENHRDIRGRDRTPEQLQTQIADAIEQELQRHQTRLGRIEEIRGMAEADGNQSALDRVAALVEKENSIHEKKMNKFKEMEARLAQRMDGKAEQGKKNSSESTEQAQENTPDDN